MSIKAKITLKDAYSSVAEKVASKAKNMAAALTKAKGAADKLNGKKIDIGVKDKAKRPLDKINDKLKKVHKTKVKPTIDVEDKASSKLDGIISKSKKIAIAVAAAKIALETGKAIWSAGTALESQKVSMTHFLGGDTAKSEKYLSSLRDNANKTPFETGEVIAAGTRAIQIADGDTKSAMEMVRIAEDMAALTPGKTIEMAMEALADAKMGEMERLKEFGFKGSKELFDKAGGNILKMQGVNGKSLNQMFAGGAGKLSTTGAGLLSTAVGSIKSGFADGSLKVVEKLKPALEKLIPAAKAVGEAFPKIFDVVINKVGEAWAVVEPAFKGAVAAVTPLISSVLAVSIPAFDYLASFVGAVLTPTLAWLGKSGEILGGIFEVTLVPAAELLGSVYQTLADTIRSVSEYINSLLSGEWLSGMFKGAKEVDVSGISAAFAPLNPMGHSTGSLYFQGGLTRINELGQEMIDLPKGSRIYPAAKTAELISRELGGGQSANNINLTVNVTTGGEIDETRLGDIIYNRFKLAYDNAVG